MTAKPTVKLVMARDVTPKGEMRKLRELSKSHGPASPEYQAQLKNMSDQMASAMKAAEMVKGTRADLEGLHLSPIVTLRDGRVPVTTVRAEASPDGDDVESDRPK